MKRLLSIEFQKIWLNNPSRILTITYFALLSLIALITAIKFDIGDFHFNIAEIGIFNFPYIWHFNTYFADYFKFFLAIVIVSMMANEYSYGTLKQNLIDGLSKKELVKSKVLTVFAMAAASTIFVFLLSLVLGLIHSSFTEFRTIITDIDYLLGYFIKLSAFFSLCLFVGILVKRSAFALGFLIILYIATAILHAILRFKVLDTEIADAIMQFAPTNAISDIIVEPISRLSAVQQMGAQVGLESDKKFDVNYKAAAISLCWTAVFIIGSYRILKRRDL